MATPNTSSLKTIVVKAGECIVLPQGATISSIILDGAVSVTSTCGELPTPTVYKCGYFYFNIDDDNNDNHPMDEGSTYITSVVVGGNTYLMNVLANSATDAGLNLNITYLALFKFTSTNIYTIDDPGDNKRKAVFLYFRVPEVLWDTVKLQVKSHTNKTLPATQYYLPVETNC